MIIDQYGWYNNSEDKSVGGITEYLCYQMVERERARKREREREGPGDWGHSFGTIDGLGLPSSLRWARQARFIRKFANFRNGELVISARLGGFRPWQMTVVSGSYWRQRDARPRAMTRRTAKSNSKCDSVIGLTWDANFPMRKLVKLIAIIWMLSCQVEVIFLRFHT